MTIRHICAFFLVSWYLLYPPFNSTKGTVDSNLPLKYWYQVGIFTSSADCEKSKIKTLEVFDSQTHYVDRAKRIAQREMREQAQCIAIDDPRLSN
jgi:hypothetical protein